MKIARSMNHGNSQTPAELIRYEDCRNDRVTCLACGDRVFKVVRRGDPEQHFLSHYSFAANPRECEERVRIMHLASMKSEAKPISEERRRQGLHMRVRALGRILMDQFPDVARASNGFAKRLDAATINNGPEKQIPQTTFELPILGTFFQLFARQDGFDVAHSDLVFTYMQKDWSRRVSVASRWAPSTMRRTCTAAGSEQDRWARGMTSLLCLASSHTPLVMLARHAWADLMVNGVRDRAQGADHRRRALEVARKTFDDPMHDGTQADFDARVPDPFATDTNIRSLFAGMVVMRMRDVLAGIDYGAPVPNKGLGSREPMEISMPISGDAEVQKLFGIRDSIAKGPSLPIGRITFASSRVSLPSAARP